MIPLPVINGETAVHRSEKFAVMGARTRRELLKDVVENHASHADVSASRIATRLLGSGSSRRGPPKGGDGWGPVVDALNRGALGWEALVLQPHRQPASHLPCLLGVSSDSVVLLRRPCGSCMWATSTHSVIGWTSAVGQPECLHLFYDHGSLLQLRFPAQRCLAALLQRLAAVTPGCETQEHLLRGPPGERGFAVQEEGIVTEVDMYGPAWAAGLRQGSRIVNIAGQLVLRLGGSSAALEEAVAAADPIRLLAIPPGEDGAPRRGCADPHCGEVPPPPLRLPPPPYEEAARRLQAPCLPSNQVCPLVSRLLPGR